MCRRGKDNEKHFTVYVLQAEKDFRESFKPKLSDESLDWGWFDIEEVEDLKKKHPRLNMLFHGKYKRDLERIMDKLDD